LLLHLDPDLVLRKSKEPTAADGYDATFMATFELIPTLLLSKSGPAPAIP